MKLAKLLESSSKWALDMQQLAINELDNIETDLVNTDGGLVLKISSPRVPNAFTVKHLRRDIMSVHYGDIDLFRAWGGNGAPAAEVIKAIKNVLIKQGL